MNKGALLRASLLQSVVDSLRASDANDLPMIRQTINDTADMFRKDGYSVRDFAQDKLVRDVQTHLRARL